MDSNYYYMDENSVIRIRAKRKPVKRSRPYALREFTGRAWEMPCFPEISWGRLSKMNYIGSVAICPK